MSARRCTGVVLAGGRASRMAGRPKGLERVGGRRILDRVSAALASAADDLVIVANDLDAASWLPGVRVIPDVRPGYGALSGLHAALTATGTDVLVVAWDTPFVSSELLWALREAGEREAVDAAAPTSDARFGFEPLCAWYAPNCLPAVEAALDDGRLHAGGWQGAIHLHTLDPSPYGDPQTIFFNVNTPEDLLRAETLL